MATTNVDGLGEVWKDIAGYEGYYQISNLARIRSMYHSKDARILKPWIGGVGYWYIVLTKDKKHKYFSLHRLLAQAFLPPVPDKPYVNHIDGNKQNCSLPNLEWVTHKENMHHAYRTNLIPPTSEKKKYARAKVVTVHKANGDFVGTYKSASDAAVALGIPSRRVCANSQMKRTFRGYQFEYTQSNPQ